MLISYFDHILKLGERTSVSAVTDDVRMLKQNDQDVMVTHENVLISNVDVISPTTFTPFNALSYRSSDLECFRETHSESFDDMPRKMEIVLSGTGWRRSKDRKIGKSWQNPMDKKTKA
jgi:hypothetical protein